MLKEETKSTSKGIEVMEPRQSKFGLVIKQARPVNGSTEKKSNQGQKKLNTGEIYSTQQKQTVSSNNRRRGQESGGTGQNSQKQQQHREKQMIVMVKTQLIAHSQQHKESVNTCIGRQNGRRGSGTATEISWLYIGFFQEKSG